MNSDVDEVELDFNLREELEGVAILDKSQSNSRGYKSDLSWLFECLV